MKKNKINNFIKLLLVGFIGLLIGWLLSQFSNLDHSDSDHLQAKERKKEEVWTCAMHPQIRLPKKGKCPICFMDLIRLEQSGFSEDHATIKVSKYAAKLMDVETTPVVRRFVEADVRMVGKVSYDETRVSYISSWVSGRVDRIFIDYTGITVRKGDHMIDVYSPMLLSAQEELLQAIKTNVKLKDSQSKILRATGLSTVKASKEKLLLLGLKPEQVEKIIRTNVVADHITIYSPANGIVIHKNVQEGKYIKTGSQLYTIVDLSTVWVKLDAYESDLSWLSYGGKVEFTTEAYPGEVFKGMISFIDPIINASSRTVKVRVTVKNGKFSLKPGMFVHATVHPQITESGNVYHEDLKGKWVGAMHPEIIKDHPDNCDICGMPLVRAETLGYVSSEKVMAPLVIPVTAALKTGVRAVVYVSVPNIEKPTYEGREVVLGARLGNFYIVKSGLEENELVVTRGAFKLDAEMQIQAKFSMMSAERELKRPLAVKNVAKPVSMVAPPRFGEKLGVLMQQYFAIQKALSIDNVGKTEQAIKLFKVALLNVPMEDLQGEWHMLWMKQVASIKSALKVMQSEQSLIKQREGFFLLSNGLTRVLEIFKIKGTQLYQATCPMAFNNRGATWLQNEKQTTNPYFGQSMLRCGDVEPLDAKGELNE